MMLRNVLFLLGALVIAALWLWVFRTFGMWTWIGLMVILVVGLLAGTKPKFGKKQKPPA